MLSFFYSFLFLLISQAPAWLLFLIQGGVRPFLPMMAKMPMTMARTRIILSIQTPEEFLPNFYLIYYKN